MSSMLIHFSEILTYIDHLTSALKLVALKILYDDEI